MSCDVAKFTITRNQDNEFIFTIKADGSTLPMVIDTDNDIFEAKLIDLETLAVVDTTLLTISDAANGKVKLRYSDIATNTMNGGNPLVSKRGSEVDRYYPKPTYKIHIKCITTNNGEFIAKVPEVYVD